MIFPSTSVLRNILAQKSNGLFGVWNFLNHDTQEVVCSFDSFVSFGFNKNITVVEYPIEEGSFATYNKQREPFTINVVLSKSGLSLAYERKKFLDTLDKYCDGINTVDVVTPSKTYLNCTLSGLDFKNLSQENADILLVQLSIKEVIELASTNNTADNLAANPSQTNAASTKNSGLKVVTV